MYRNKGSCCTKKTAGSRRSSSSSSNRSSSNDRNNNSNNDPHFNVAREYVHSLRVRLPLAVLHVDLHPHGGSIAAGSPALRLLAVAQGAGLQGTLERETKIAGFF